MKHTFLDKEEDWNMRRNFETYIHNPEWKIARGVRYSFYVFVETLKATQTDITIQINGQEAAPIFYVEKYRTDHYYSFRIPASLLYMLLKLQ